MSVIVFFLFTLFLNIQGQILDDYSCVFDRNYYIQWKAFPNIPKTSFSWPYFSFVVRTNALYGYTFVALSPQIDNFTNGIVFASYYDPQNPLPYGNPNVYFYEPRTATPDNPFNVTFKNVSSIPTWKRLIFEETWKPLSSSRPQLLYDEFTVGILFNYTYVYPDFFNRVPNNLTDWYVYIATNKNQKPSSPFDPTKFPPIEEEGILRIIDFTVYDSCFVAGIYRWSVLTIPTFVIELLFYAILVPICFILSKISQPMISRGFTPSLASASQFTVLLAQIHYLAADVQTVHLYDCLFLIFFYYSATQVSLILLPIHLVRYIFIINLNKSKDIFYSKIQITKDGEKKKVEVARWPFRFVKILTNQWLNLIIVILWYIFSVSVQLITFFASNLSCSVASFPLGTLQTVVVIFFIICWTLGLIYDFVYNILDLFITLKQKHAKGKTVQGATQTEKPNLCKESIIFFWELFTKKDPFYYRFELYFIGPVIIVFYIVVALSILILKLDTNRYASIATSSILFHLLLFYQVLFPLVLTIIEIIRQCFNPKKSINEEIDICLFDVKGHQMFVDFAKSEWSTENISAFDDIQRFKKEKDQQKKLTMAEEIFLTYFNSSKSKLEVNVNSKICDAIKRKIDEAKNEELFINKPLEDKMFDEAEGALKINLCDTFSRLRLTNQYKDFMQQYRFKQQALGTK